MAEPFSNDLRRRLLLAYERGEGSLRQLAVRFTVSFGFAKKIRQQQRKSGKTERPLRVYQKQKRLTEPMLKDVHRWVEERADRTLMELQEKIQQAHKIQVSLATIFRALKELGFRLKKNSTRRSKIGPRSNRPVRLSGKK